MARRAFTLFELILVAGILGIFLFICTNSLVSTLELTQEIDRSYDMQRRKSLGWNALHRDLASTLGIYYHHQSLWEPPGTETQKKPTPAPKGDEAKKKKKKKKPSKKATSDELVIFEADPSLDDPFLEIVVSRGRLRDVDEDGELKNIGAGFRKVKYYIGRNTLTDGEGDVILRTEEPWVSSSDQKGKKIQDEEQEFDLDDMRRHALVTNIEDVELEVYDGKEWVEDWSSIGQGDLPLALRISYLRGDEENGDRLNRIFPFPLSYRPVEEPEEAF